MVSKVLPSARAGKLSKLFHDFIKGDRLIQSSQDAKLFFEGMDTMCLQKSAAASTESIISNTKGIEVVSSAMRSNLSPDFITTTSLGFLKHLSDPQVKAINDGQFLQQLLAAILSPPTFWTALLRCHHDNALQDGRLETFAWLCLEIVSTQSADLQVLFPDVKSLMESNPLTSSSFDAVRTLGYRIQKVIQLRDGPATASISINYSPGGRHDNDFEDFRQISIYPTADEVSSKDQPFLQRLDDVFEVPRESRARNHLDWLFRLLREDMLADLREDLQIAWGQKKAKRRSLCLGGFSVVGFDVGNIRSTRPFTLLLECCEGITFPKSRSTSPEAKKKYLEEFKNFVRHNSFGAFCSNRSIVAFGSIVRDTDLLVRDPPVVGIQFTNEAGLKRALEGALFGPDQQHLKFFVVETATFAYEPVLQRLKEITEVPLENSLLDPKGIPADYQPPVTLQGCLQKWKQAMENGEHVDLSNFANKSVLIGGAQLKSLINGLESPLGQIQGPPGTGKSFIGALIVLIILKLTNHRILVLSYTNHALDQFLEDLMNIGISSNDMVRLGSKGTTRTEHLRIEYLAKEPRYRLSLSLGYRLNTLKSEYAEVNSKLEDLIEPLRKTRIHARDILEMLEFSEDCTRFWAAFQVENSNEGFNIAGRNGHRPITAEHIYDAWAEGKDPMKVGMLKAGMDPNCRSVWNMPPKFRWELHQKWCSQVRKEKIEEFVQLAETSNELQQQIDSIFKETKREILRSKRVIGCTTTAAAMYQSIIKAAEPDVVLVEEAGEILEAHVITAMSPTVKQLILIGDHKQLRPKVNNYNLTVEKGEGFDLNVSLFERLIRQGHHFTTLQEQHRSHPDISQFTRLLAYEGLVDSPKTLQRAKVRGLHGRVTFVHHEHREEQLEDVTDRRDPSSKSSKKNVFEADMVLKLVKYLNQQGYKSENLVVLTPYLGQLSLLRQKLGEDNDPYLNDLDSYELLRAGLMTRAEAKVNKSRLRLSTIDNYQGEECDIVIISLTRSNEKGDIGFLIARERLAVLMSRARDCVVLFGNLKTFRESKKGGEMWKQYSDALKEKGFLFDGVPVHCEQHPDRSALLKTPGDFDQHCPDGGCAELCGAMLGCGKHTCERRCHRLTDHSKVACTKLVPKTCERGHKRKFQCGNENQGCKDCAREDEENRRRTQRDFEMEKKRQEAQDKYRRELQEMEDQIDHHRRAMKYQEEEDTQKKTLTQKKAKLQSLKETQARMDAAKASAKSANDQVKSGESSKDTNRSSRLNPVSKAGQEWEYMKRNEGARNSALDELMDLIGLEVVKKDFLSIKSTVDTKIRQGVSLSQERLSCSLLGNPGTGKTTVARLWGRFLTGIGAIAGDCFKETTGSKLANIGVSGCEKLLEEIKNDGGGVLFIDEAYQLSSGNSPGGKAVLDYLLAEVDNPGLVVVLAGYSKQMESFFAHNPGFQSRFPIEMKFEDYTDDELRQILERKVRHKFRGKMQVEGGTDGLYFRIAARRVGRGRGKEGFGNARAIENALARIEKRQAARFRLERRANTTPDDFLFTKEDIIGPEPSVALSNCKAWRKLNEMIGLKEVKQEVKIFLDSIKTNYDRELAEEPPMEFSLNRVFLGSPGTGKTTVAKLYGEILATLGLISNGEVVVKTPADFVGSALGQSEAQTKSILAATVGKVLVIDEAYGLCGGQGSVADPYKTAVVDTIVGEVQNVPGDDRCVILIGYQEQMEQMFRSVNPGLSRRFSVDSPFVFEDFDDDGLRQVLDLKLKASGFTTTGEGKRAALDVIIRERNKPNFGNGGAIENLLSKAKAAYQKRLSAGKIKRNQLEAMDFDEDFDRSTRKTNVRQLFQDEVGREKIIEMLEEIQGRVRQLKAIGMDVEEEIPFNFLFRGPPGTGKTTTARKMGKVYYDMGFLGEAKLTECSATDLIGQYVGQTGPKVQNKLDEALGGVLLIDEAYRLAEGAFSKEAIDELVDCVTKPRYQGKLIIILAGYENDINRLLSVNPGLSSRFPETIEFEPLSSEHCLQLLTSLLGKRKTEIKRKTEPKGKILDLSCLESPSGPFKNNILQIFKSLAMVEGWASARDVKELAKNIFRRIDLAAQTLKLHEDQVIQELDKMLRDRLARMRRTDLPPAGNVPTAMMDATQRTFQTNLPFHISTNSEVRQEVNDGEAADDSPEPEPPGQTSHRQPVRDAGVSDEVWEQLQKDRAEEERRETEYRELLKAQKTARDADREKIVRQVMEEEARRKREEEQRAKLAARGVCPVGFQWIKQASGFRCAGGSHYMSDGDLEKL